MSKLLLLFIGVMIFLLYTTSCHKGVKPNLDGMKPQPIITKNDSVCGLPFFGCVYGVNLLATDSIIHGDTIVVKLFLKHVPMPDTPTGRWFAVTDQFVKMTFVKDFCMTSFIGSAEGEDSVRFKELLSQ